MHNYSIFYVIDWETNTLCLVLFNVGFFVLFFWSVMTWLCEFSLNKQEELTNLLLVLSCIHNWLYTYTWQRIYYKLPISCYAADVYSHKVQLLSTVVWCSCCVQLYNAAVVYSCTMQLLCILQVVFVFSFKMHNAPYNSENRK